MRVSTHQMFQRAISGMLEQQARLSKTQEQIATGRRVVVPADDPAAAAQIVALQRELQMTEQYQKNTDTVENRLGYEEGVLQSVTESLQRIRELTVRGNNDTLTSQDRGAIALELREQLDGLVRLANSKDLNGEYLFSGYEVHTQPFAHDGRGGFTYAGDQGQRDILVGPRTQLGASHSGAEVFMAILNGNGTFVARAADTNAGTGVIGVGSVTAPAAYVEDDYTISFVTNAAGELGYRIDGVNSGQVTPVPPADPALDAPAFVSGQSIGFAGMEVEIRGEPQPGDQFTVTPSEPEALFATVYQLASTLEQGGGQPADSARFHSDVNRLLQGLDNALGHIVDIRAEIGARLSTVDSQRNVNEDHQLRVNSLLAEVRDLDYAEAISRMNQELMTLDAAQKTYVKVQGMSLFNYI